MPLIKSPSKKAFNRNVEEMIHAGHPINQSIAAAYSTQREAKERAFGGVAPMLAQASNPVGIAGVGIAGAGMPKPFKDGGVATLTPHPVGMTTGPLVSTVPGRTDRHYTHVPSGSYVIPADIVSGHGEGNTLAGIANLHKLFKMGPHEGPVSAPSYHAQHFSKGGSERDRHVGKPVPVKLAGGEIVVPPKNVHETMQRIHKKKLTLDEAHAKMDGWVVDQRKKLRKTLAKLPPPVRD